MELETEAACGAAHGERSTDRLVRRNGYRERDWETRAGTVELRIPRLCKGSYFPSFLDPSLPFHVLRTRNLRQLRPGAPGRKR